MLNCRFYIDFDIAVGSNRIHMQIKYNAERCDTERENLHQGRNKTEMKPSHSPKSEVPGGFSPFPRGGVGRGDTCAAPPHPVTLARARSLSLSIDYLLAIVIINRI